MANPPDAPIEFGPTGHRHTHTVVFLHGRGGDAEGVALSLGVTKKDLEGFPDVVKRFPDVDIRFPDKGGQTLVERFPTFRWVFPRAPRSELAGSRGTFMNQWFDIFITRDISKTEQLLAVGLKESVPRIRRILASEAERLNGRWDCIILAGISQGSATSVHTLLNLDLPLPADGSPRRLGAFMGFCSRMPFPHRSLEDTRKILDLPNTPNHDDVLRHTPMLLEHGDQDPTVPVEWGRELRDTLRRFGADVTWREYPNDPIHWFNSTAGITDAVAFLTKVVTAQGWGYSVEMDLSP